MSLDDVKCGLQNEVLCLQNFFERAFAGIAITWMLIISINHNTVPPKKPQVYDFLSINLTQSEPPIHFQSQKSLKKFLFYQNLYRTQRTTQEHLKRRWCCPIDPQKCCPTYPNSVVQSIYEGVAKTTHDNPWRYFPTKPSFYLNQSISRGCPYL